MTRKALRFYHITLLIFCQALAFCALTLPTKAVSNEITITCPAESAANSDISCTLGGKTTSEINNITLTITPSNLKIKEFKPASGWINNSSATSTSLNLSSNTPTSSSFSLGTLILTTTSANQSGTIVFENIEFQKTDNYRFNAAGTGTSIKITEAPVTPTCAEDEELINGICTKKQKICAENEELINGECVKKTPTCADDEELIDGKCIKKETVCKDDEEFIDGECKKKKPICKSDEELVDGKCVKKIIAPICKDDEELINNTCQKKSPEIDWTLIAIVAGGSILIIGIIIAIILVAKKGKKGAGINGYTSFSGSPNLSTDFRSTSVRSSVGNYSSMAQPQTSFTQAPVANTTVSNNNGSNGTFLAQSGEIIEGQQIEPKPNIDPRLQMQIQNPNQNITPDSTNPNDSLTNQIEQGTAMASYDDPRLQYNFSENRPITSTAQPQITPVQAPIVSAYDVAAQAAAQPERQSQQIIQDAPIITAQPTEPTINQPQSQNLYMQSNQYHPTASVPLSAPTDPTVFES